MSISRLLVFGILSCLSAVFGCASTSAVYGERARFSPAFQGYVMASNDGSDDPGKEDKVLLLRDPVTGNKLRCREDVLEWRELYEDTAVDQLHDHRAAIAAGVTAGAIFGPLLAVQPVGGLLLWEGLTATQDLYELFRSDDAAKLLAAGIHLYDRKRYPQASLFIERALAKDGDMGTSQKAYYYLGLAYVEQGKHKRARTALSAFMDRAAVRNVDDYRKAESTLKALGVVRKACGSMEPVELYW